VSLKLEWFPINTVHEATAEECLHGLWLYDTDGGVIAFTPFCKGYWRIPSSVTHWAYGDKPNKPKSP